MATKKERLQAELNTIKKSLKDIKAILSDINDELQEIVETIEIADYAIEAFAEIWEEKEE